MTAGNNGTPENGEDDPFGYLYRGDGEQAAPTERPGVPRTSYHQVSRVGERRGTPPQGGYGYPQQQPYGQPQQQAPYGQQQGYGQQPPGPGRPAQGLSEQPRGGRAADRAAASGASNRRGLMIGAIAVVVVVAVGIAIAVATGNKKTKEPSAGGPTGQQTAATGPQTPSASASADPNATLPKTFAAALTLGGQAAVASTDQGATGPNGSYVTMPNVGDSATWNVTVPTAGTYRLYFGYGNAGQPATATLTVNGTAQTRPVNLDNFTHQSDPTHAWTKTWQVVQVKQGANTFVLSCAQGNQCAFDLDTLWLHTN